MPHRSALVLVAVSIVSACGKAPAPSAAVPANAASAPIAPPSPPGASAGPLVLAKDPSVAHTFATSTRFSQKAKAACTTASDDDPQRALAAAEKACAGVGLKAIGAPFAANVNGAGGAAEWAVDLEAGRCYRVVAAAAKSVRFLTVMVRDADGAIAGEGVGERPAAGAPASGVMCPRSRERVVILLSAGSGEGLATARLFAE
jgi:hypothetical protein